MKRKLFSLLLCVIALLLLMGAGIQQSAALSNENEEKEAVAVSTRNIDEPAAIQAAEGGAIIPVEIVEGDAFLLVNGEPVGYGTDRVVVDGVTCVALVPMVRAIAPDAVVSLNNETGIISVVADGLSMSTKQGWQYIEANGRYLYVPDGVKEANGVTMVPLNVLVEAFDATLNWDGATGVTDIVSGSGAIVPGDQFYNQDDLFWLSRVIFAESGGHRMDGQIAVGNVIMNRITDDYYPDTLLGVISQKNQFSTYKGGALADRVPSQMSVVSAKLVLDGAVVEEVEGALYFDSASNSWASRNKEHIATINNHRFFAK